MGYQRGGGTKREGKRSRHRESEIMNKEADARRAKHPLEDALRFSL